jgi:hypothetical protein
MSVLMERGEVRERTSQGRRKKKYEVKQRGGF